MTETFDAQNLFPIVESKPPVKGHTCEICQKWFKKSSDLRRHGSVHSTEKPFKCDHCNRRFSSKTNLQTHLRYIKIGKSFQCELCGKSFKTRGALKSHLATHAQEKRFKCEMCNKMFGRKNALELHYSSQKYLNNHRQFEEFKQFEYLVEKYQQVDDNVVHICTYCNKQFKGAHHLNQHIRYMHEIGKIYQCTVCFRKFKRKSCLDEHNKLLHSQRKKTFTCEICQNQFYHIRNFKRHQGVHTTDKPYKCEKCSSTFKTKSALNKHAVVHSQEKPYTCVICFKSFARVYGLNLHTRLHTGERPYSCDICDKTFVTSSSLYKHSKTCKDDKEHLLRLLKSLKQDSVEKANPPALNNGNNKKIPDNKVIPKPCSPLKTNEIKVSTLRVIGKVVLQNAPNLNPLKYAHYFC